MSQVTVRKADKNNSSTSSLLESLNSISNSIRSRAFELSRSRGGANGDATRDWLQAEKDLFCVPESQLSENENMYQMQVAVPGCDSTNVEVIALSSSIVVRSSSGRSNSGQQGRTISSDFDSRMMFRRFDLSSSIDTSNVTANLDNGMLSISAQKSTSGSRSSAAGA